MSARSKEEEAQSRLRSQLKAVALLSIGSNGDGVHRIAPLNSDVVDAEHRLSKGVNIRSKVNAGLIVVGAIEGGAGSDEEGVGFCHASSRSAQAICRIRLVLSLSLSLSLS